MGASCRRTQFFNRDADHPFSLLLETRTIDRSRLAFCKNLYRPLTGTFNATSTNINTTTPTTATTTITAKTDEHWETWAFCNERTRL